jgi:hypothetical protein
VNRFGSLASLYFDPTFALISVVHFQQSLEVVHCRFSWCNFAKLCFHFFRLQKREDSTCHGLKCSSGFFAHFFCDCIVDFQFDFSKLFVFQGNLPPNYLQQG